MEQPNQSSTPSTDPPSGPTPEEPRKDAPAANSLDAEPGTTPEPAASSETNLTTADNKPVKKPNAFKVFLKRFNLYFLLFVFIVIIAGAITIVSYLNSKKAAPTPSISTQELNQDTLKQLQNSDATVGGSGQTLTVQGNAIFAGQILAKNDLGVAGSIVTNSLKAGTEITVPQITVSAKSNLNDTQIANLQVSGSTTVQGPLTLQRDLNVAGTSSFNGPVTIGQLNVTNLTMSGNSSLRILNHIAFPGASPGRSINPSVLGSGGTATIGGSDTTGTINISTGNNPTPGCFARMTFSQKFASEPHVIVSPVGSAAAQAQYYVDRDASGFSICSANAAPARAVFAYDYFITQ